MLLVNSISDFPASALKVIGIILVNIPCIKMLAQVLPCLDFVFTSKVLLKVPCPHEP